MQPLHFLPVAVGLSFIVACEKSPIEPETTPVHPGLEYGWVSAEGSILVLEEPYVGEFEFICPTGSTTVTTSNGTYSVLLRLERPENSASTETCRIEVGGTLPFTREAELPVAASSRAAVQTSFDAILFPDPPPVAHMERPIIDIAVGGAHSCALGATGIAYCWGRNSHAELGVGTHMPTNYAARVLTDERFTDIAASGYEREWDGSPYMASVGSCALRADGAVYCWGNGYRHVMALGTTIKQTQTPQPVVGLPPAVHLIGAAERMCARTAADVYCWGAYANVARVNLPDIVDIDVSESHACAVTPDGQWHCWGLLVNWGEAGDSTAPHPPFHQITTGDAFTCALDEGGAAWCWGRNQSGQLGRGTVTAGVEQAPQPVNTALRFTEIGAGQFYACGLAADGSAWCWGRSEAGQRGDGTTGNIRTTPVRVGAAGQMQFSKLSVGDEHACAISTEGSRVYCWGAGTFGQLGNYASVDQSSPVLVWQQ